MDQQEIHISSMVVHVKPDHLQTVKNDIERNILRTLKPGAYGIGESHSACNWPQEQYSGGNESPFQVWSTSGPQGK